MKQYSIEAKRMQQLAGLLSESPDIGLDKIALDYSNTAPNTPPGATPGIEPGKTEESIVGGLSVSADANNAYNAVLELDTPDMEVFLRMLSGYFRRNVEGLQNMDAIKIADHLQSAHDLVKSRSGN